MNKHRGIVCVILAQCTSEALAFSSFNPRGSFYAKKGVLNRLDRAVARSHLDDVSNQSFGNNDKDKNMDEDNRLGVEPSEQSASSTSMKETSNSRSLFKPHAPNTPPPSTHEGNEDEDIINEARELMKIQRAMRKASSSPTYVIPKRPAAASPTSAIIIPEKKDASKTEAPSNSETASTLSSSVDFLQPGPGRIQPYRNSMEMLRDSRRRAQKRLSRSDFEKQKAEEKKAKIKAKLEAQVMEIDNKLKEKMNLAQNAIDEEVERMKDLIIIELSLEDERKSQFKLLANNLKASIKAIENDIHSEKKILGEMIELRFKLKENSGSASQLDELLIQKNHLLSIEEKLLEDLNQCIVETRRAMEDCELRSSAMEQVLDKIDRPILDALNRDKQRQYVWSDIDDMEIVLEEATQDVSASEVRVAALKKRIDYALMEKDAILCAGTQTRNTKDSNKMVSSRGARSVEINLSDLQGWNDTDVVKQLAVSIGNATFSGSKAAIFALKTFIDAASNQEVTMVASAACDKSKMISTATNDTFKELAGDALDSYVDTAKKFFEKASSNDAGREAQLNLNDATKELMTAANAIAALGMRAYQKLADPKK